MTSILRNGYTVLNPISPNGVAVAGNAGSGSLSQYNNKQTDTVEAGDTSQDGSVRKLIATDSQDTVNLGSGWTNAGTATDDTTGITGTLYTSASGDQLLISGGATVNQKLSADPPPDKPADPPAQSSQPAQTTAPQGTSSKPPRPVQTVNKPAPVIKKTANPGFFSNLVSSYIYNNAFRNYLGGTSSYSSYYSRPHLNTFGLASVKPVGYYA